METITELKARLAVNTGRACQATGESIGKGGYCRPCARLPHRGFDQPCQAEGG